MNLNVDKRNDIIRINRLAKTAIDIFNDILNKKSLDKKDLELIIDKIKYNDIALLADLMGHESIETTRIYLRRTASEQQALVDKIVTW